MEQAKKLEALEKYSNSKEWKDIVKKLEADKEKVKTEIWEDFTADKEDKNKAKHSKHDTFYQDFKLYTNLALLVKGNTAGSKLLQQFLQERLDLVKENIIYTYRDDFGLTFSSETYTDLDMKRLGVNTLTYLTKLVDTLITESEKSEQPDVEIY